MEPISNTSITTSDPQGGAPVQRSASGAEAPVTVTLVELGKVAFDEWRHSDLAEIIAQLRAGTERLGVIAAELLDSLVASRFGMITKAFDHLIRAAQFDDPTGADAAGAQIPLACGYVLLNCGRPVEAVGALERALISVSAAHDDARCRFLLAECHARVANWEAAEQHWQRAIEIARSEGFGTLAARWQINHAATLIGMAASLDAAGARVDAYRFADAALHVLAQAMPVLDDPRTPPYVHALLALRHAQALRLVGDRTSARSVLDALAWLDASPGIDELSAVRCHLEALLALDDNDAQGALAFCRQGLVVTVSPQLRHFAGPLVELSILAAERLGDHDLAQRHRGECADLHAIVSRLDADQEAMIDGCLTQLHQALGGP